MSCALVPTITEEALFAFGERLAFELAAALGTPFETEDSGCHVRGFHWRGKIYITEIIDAPR